jgi:predicted MPP superfamily phosphohydrolase
LKVTRYSVTGSKLKAAVIADLHSKPTNTLVSVLKDEQPDVILIPGDLCLVGERKDQPIDPIKHEKRLRGQETAIEFLKTVVQIAPVYYSRGNHEYGCDNEYREQVKATGAILIENEWVRFGDVWIGGLTSPKHNGSNIPSETPMPDTEWLKHSPEGYKVLLNHHPEYFVLIKDYADLILAGHSHGGQIRLFGHGLFAPGQGFLPKYSKGRYGNMIVSAGLANTTWVPRLFNPTEIVIVEMKDENE